MGFVKLPSDLTEWAWVNDNNTLAVYVRLILGATWKDREYKNVHLTRGQIVTTIPQIAEQSNLTIQQTRTVLDRLKATGKITVERTPKFSIITLVEYDCDTAINSQDNTQTTDEQQTSNSLATDKQQSGNRQTTDKQQTNNSPTYYINKKTDSKKDRRSEGEDAGARETAGALPPLKPEKIQYAELVFLTEEEHAKLIEQHGTEIVQWCIQKLNYYKGSTGKTYASDYNAILSWVIKSYREERAKQQQAQSRSYTPKAGKPNTLDILQQIIDSEEGNTE